MLSEKQRSSRSPTESVQTDSVNTGPTTRGIPRQSQRSSITEEDDDDDNIPPAPPLPQSLRAPTKSSSSSSSSSKSPTQSTIKPTIDRTNATKKTNGISSLRPNLRRESSDEQNNSARRNLNQKSTPSESKRTGPGVFGRVSARDIENEQPTSIPSELKRIIPGLLGRVSARDLENEQSKSAYISQSQKGKPNQSIFEKVDAHSGSATYLGTGTFSQLENCIRNCLSHNQPHTDYTNYTTKYDFPHKSLTRASVLEDYSYDGILSPSHHISHSTSHHYIPYSTSDDHHHHHHHHSSTHPKSAADLSLDEIRQVNDALAKYGIPILSHHEHPYNKPLPVGDIISACHQLLEDPVLRAQSQGTQAVQHVWDNLQHHSPQTNIYGYASPAVRSVASHLFNPTHQPPYSPVSSVVSHLFGNPQQSPYNPAQSAAPYPFGSPQQTPYNPAQSAAPPPYGNPQQGLSSPGQSAISRLFGNPQQSSYNPAQSATSNLFSGSPPPPQQQQQQQPFTGSPFGTAFNQYPGNNPYAR